MTLTDLGLAGIALISVFIFGAAAGGWACAHAMLRWSCPGPAEIDRVVHGRR